jgi:isopenicillin-N N-acyltransferase like protein
MLRRLLICVVVVSALAGPARAAGTFRYPEGKHGKGELRYVHGIPVLTVRGTPEEIGDQVGTLALRSLQPLFGRVHDFAKAWNVDAVFPLLLKSSSLLVTNFPADYRKELGAEAKASGIPRDLLILGNAFPDVKHLSACSTLIVEPGRGANGELLFGRNLDWFPFGDLHLYSLVTVYHPTGKHAFVAIGWPGMIGPPSGMNDAGLALAQNEISVARDGSAKFNPFGVPTLFLMRRMLEECSSVEEAQKLMASNARASLGLLTVCDRDKGRAFEYTTKNLVLRSPVDGLCASTNHFRSKELTVLSPEELEKKENCRRYRALSEKSRPIEKLTLDDVHRLMHAASAGDWTVQTMMFEPAKLRLHVAFGKGPTTALPLKTLDLRDSFSSQQARQP